ncbi:MAG: hypothetical protein DWQ36_05080 [Acidobacteria bacterium]|nr:MAG: hypothetical protein DWQ30_10440 [Acidobacteriota bacterium]REK10158.1 MAG: hypothetical protein DWQ36_05080 [Acidobacteriota bacterium]
MLEELSWRALQLRDLGAPETLRSVAEVAGMGDLELRRSATRWLMAERTLGHVGAVLDDLACPWLAIKGAAVGLLDYPVRELRPISDVDVLIPRDRLGAVREHLVAAGWQPLHAGSRAQSDYLDRLGYAWQIRRDGHLLCEVHFRLWGSLPTTAADDLLPIGGAAPLPAPPRAEGGPTKRSPGPPAPTADQRYVIAAVHALMQSGPRPLHCWWDLEWLESGVEARGVAELARRWGVQLQVVLASLEASRRFGNRFHESVTAGLHGDLRPLERRLLRRATALGESVVRRSHVNLSRLLSGRRMRLASTPAALARAVWPHPHAVDVRTPSHLTPLRRRLAAQLQLLGLQPSAGPHRATARRLRQARPAETEAVGREVPSP